MAMKVFFPSHARLRRLRYLFSLEKNQLIFSRPQRRNHSKQRNRTQQGKIP